MTTESTAAREPPGPDVQRIELSTIAEKPFAGQESEYRIVLEQAAYDNITAHGMTNTEVELCGVLVGSLYKDAHGPYLVISDAIRGREAREESSKVTFTHSAWEHIHKEMDEKHPQGMIVGWYHMHPGYGIFLSEADLFVHRHFFNAAWQVALVVDPKAQQQGVFFWDNGQIARARRYWIGQRVCWEPGERLATHVPPGTSHGKPNEGRRKSPPADDQQPEPTLFGLTSWNIPLLVVLGLLCFILGYGNLEGMLRNYRLAGQLENVQDKVSEIQQKAIEVQKKAVEENRAENRRLAGSMALWLRQRLDARGDPAELQAVYEEVLRLDKDSRLTYDKLLPELVPKPKPKEVKTKEAKPAEKKPEKP